jgi:hypothetical protein
MANKVDVSTIEVKAAKADPKAAKAAKAAKAGKADPKAAKAGKAAKADPKADTPKAAKADTFSLHLNKTGRLCIGKAAAERLGDAEFCSLKIEGKIVRLIPEKKEIEGAIPVKYADPEFAVRPYVSASKAWKSLGWDGAAGIDIEAKAYGNGGFEFRIA